MYILYRTIYYCIYDIDLTLSRPVTPNGVIVFKQWDMIKGDSKFANEVNTNEEQLIFDL